MKIAIIFASVHHGNTRKVVEQIAQNNDVDLIDATQEKEKDLSEYDRIGFASGIYYGKLIAKGHPNEKDLTAAMEFYQSL